MLDLLKFSGVPLSFVDALASRVDQVLWNPKWPLFEGTNFPAQRKQKPRQIVVHEFIAAFSLGNDFSLQRIPE